MSDLISRSAFADKMCDVCNTQFPEEPCEPSECRLCIALANAPAVDAVEVVHGRWEKVIPTKSAAKWCTKVSCSICHRQGYDHHNYCPNCGADMRERKDNDSI